MDSFEQELLAMEREVRALKTIHQRGLGTVKFYRASHTKSNASAGVTSGFEVHLADGEPTPAIFTAHVNTPTPVAGVDVSIFGRSYGALVNVFTWQAGTIKVDVVCSSQIQEIVEA